LDRDAVNMLKISKIVLLTANPNLESQLYENHWYYY
jgi:hypothetical protein